MLLYTCTYSQLHLIGTHLQVSFRHKTKTQNKNGFIINSLEISISPISLTACTACTAWFHFQFNGVVSDLPGKTGSLQRPCLSPIDAAKQLALRNIEMYSVDPRGLPYQNRK